MNLSNLVANAMMATLLSASAYASLPSSQSKPLMASMLPDYIAHDTKLSYAKDHAFYDTPVRLIDENSQVIRFQHQISPAHHYQIIPEGKTRITYKNIWFFSKSGTVQHFDGNNDLSKCIAQNPCSNVDQTSIDRINTIKSGAALWFNKGDYLLPLMTQNGSNSNILRLYNKQVIMGRSQDFERVARANERPRFLGTLAWPGYVDHAGSNGEIEAVRILTKNNFFEADNGDKISTNIYATGNIIVNKTELISRDIVDIETDGLYSSIFSYYADVRNTTIYVNANQSIGIFAGKATAYETEINSSGQSAIGLYLFDFPESKDKRSNYDNYFSKLDITSSGGLAFGIMANGENISFSLGSITTDASFYSVGIANPEGINFNAITQFDIRSELIATGIEASTCIFTNNPSFVKVNAPMGGLFNLSDNKLINESEPPSRCQLNKGKEDNCSYNHQSDPSTQTQIAQLKQHLNTFASNLIHKGK